MSDPVPRRDVAGIAGAAFFIVVGSLAIWHARDFSPLGSVFPRTIGATMVLLSIVYIVMAVARPGGAPPPAGGSNVRRTALVAVMLAWAMLFETVGFLSTSVAAYALIMLIANYDRWTPGRAVAYVAAGALLLGGLYAVFAMVLQVPLPAGWLL